MSQTGLVRVAGGHALALTESGVIETTAGSTETLPTLLSAAVAAQTWVVVNASATKIFVITGTGGLVDNWVGGLQSGSVAQPDIVDANTVATYTPDTNLIDWVRT